MILGEDGFYYLGKEKKVKITQDLIDQVYDKLVPFFYSHTFPISTIMNIEGKDYKFSFPKENDFLLSYEDENGNLHLINHRSIKIIFKIGTKSNERDIFTYEQY